MYSDGRRRLIPGLLAAGMLLAAGGVSARDLPSLAQALERNAPGAAVERKRVVLTDAQEARVKELTGKYPESRMVSLFELRKEDQIAGYAYLDVERVRTLPQTLLITLDATGRILAVDVLAFAEPPEYMPRETWYAKFKGFTVDGKLELNRGVDAVTGATLTSRSTVSAARRVLALHEAIHGAANP